MSEPIFVTSVYSLETLPEERPFVALAGRSNVGKSSAVNALLCKKGLARVSSKPGKTASINVYDPGEGFYIADLPGYGYAKVSKTIRRGWGELMDGFFLSNPDIRLVVCFIDSRRTPEQSDLDLIAFLADAGYRFCPVFTKCDKLKKTEAEKLLTDSMKLIRRQLRGTSADMLPPVLFSATDKTGAEMLRKAIFQSVLP